MGESQDFFVYQFPSPNIEQRPILNWKDYPDKTLRIPKISFHPLFTISPAEISQQNQRNSGQQELSFAATKKGSLKTLSPLSNSTYLAGSSYINWRNQLIHGDSLSGMARLLHSGFENTVQMIYMDPPFGIQYRAKFNSGSQTSEGYIDSWQNGLNSYLEFMRERLLLCKKLLKSTGSIFIQIGEENIHYVRCLLDEIFGPENYVNLITFRTAISTNRISNVADYLVWYAKDRQTLLRLPLLKDRPLEKILKTFTYTFNDPTNGKKIPYKPQELVKRVNSKNPMRLDRQYQIIWKGTTYTPPKGFEWRWPKESLLHLIDLHRIVNINGKLYGMRLEKDFPAMIMTNIWTDTSTSTFAAKKHYTVHTNPKVIHRCISMTTRPGDLVLDPTLGSGTTAFVAEQLGRRWIGFDTSPTAVLSTINWLIGKEFPIYRWLPENQDFEYIHVNKVSLSQLAKKKASPTEPRNDRPKIKSQKGRICSPFQVDVTSISPVFPKDRSKMTRFYQNLLNQNGIFLPNGQTQILENITPIDAKNTFFETMETIYPEQLSQNDLTKTNKKNITRQTSFAKIQSIFGFSAQIHQRKVDILILQSLDEILLKSIAKVLYPWMMEQSNDVLLFTRHSPMGLLDSVLTINANLERENRKNLLYLGNIHPDLDTHQLNFQHHSEAFRLMGRCVSTSNGWDLCFQSLKSHESFSLDLKNVAMWMILEKPKDIANLWKTMGNCSLIHTPFYQKFMDSALKSKLEYNLFNYPFWEKLGKKYLFSPQPIIYVLDYRGNSYYGFLNEIKYQ